MARTPKKAKTKAEIEDGPPLRIIVDLPRETPTYYANHIEIAINRHEVALWVVRLPTKPGRDELLGVEETGALVVDAEMQILIPPTLIDGLITALETTKTNFETAFGPIRKIKA